MEKLSWEDTYAMKKQNNDQQYIHNITVYTLMRFTTQHLLLHDYNYTGRYTLFMFNTDNFVA